MTDPVKRGTRRAEQARATRRRIIAAATELFVTHGYGGTRLDQVAEQSGVAIQTVYFHFGNKHTLLKEALDVAAAGDDEPVPLLDRPWLIPIRQEPDPRQIIRMWLANSRSILERAAPLMRVVRGATGTDPELAAQWHIKQQQTRAAYAVLVQLLNDRGALNPALTLDHARDVAFVLANIDSYLGYSDICGWTFDQWQHQTTQVLIAALLPGEGGGAVQNAGEA
ncbi:TetR/AcrR family transcriptional regulator [Nonomuraea sp. NPDC003709]|uniref:TetR/AcrR family transcriptional regulator n=1 Tax=Nonomuraea sp. NPDC003709 TaxID=3154450 RepID=UPI0033AA1EFA